MQKLIFFHWFLMLLHKICMFYTQWSFYCKKFFIKIKFSNTWVYLYTQINIWVYLYLYLNFYCTDYVFFFTFISLTSDSNHIWNHSHYSICKHLNAFSCLRHFLATESPLKMMKNAFYFTFKALCILKIFKFLSLLSDHAKKWLD